MLQRQSHYLCQPDQHSHYVHAAPALISTSGVTARSRFPAWAALAAQDGAGPTAQQNNQLPEIMFFMKWKCQQCFAERLFMAGPTCARPCAKKLLLQSQQSEHVRMDE